MKKRNEKNVRKRNKDYSERSNNEYGERPLEVIEEKILINREQYRKRRQKLAARRRLQKRILILCSLILMGGLSWNYFVNNEVGASTTDNDKLVVDKEEAEEIVIEEIEEKRVSFLAVGDNLGHMTVNNYADKQEGGYKDGTYDYLPLYKNVSSIIAEVDLAFINQETMIAGDSLGISGYPLFNSPEAWARDVTALGFDIVNAASNHTLDKGFTGVQNAAEIWSQYEGITYVGAYTSQEDADTIRLVERNGITFSVLAYTYGTNGIPKPNEYCVLLLEEERIKSDVAKAKQISDIVIVSAHWGDEGSLTPNSTQKQYAQVFADAGVDIVVGHHSHTVQPIQWVEGVEGNETLVVYGLGNFISTMTSVDNQLEIMLTLDFVMLGDEVSIENILVKPMVNHYDTNGATLVYFIEDYTTTLVSKHRNLAGKKSDVLGYYDTKLKEAIPLEYLQGTEESAAYLNQQ